MWALVVLRKSRNIKICMGKKPIVSVTYGNERISIKHSLPYIKCVFHSWSCFKTFFFYLRQVDDNGSRRLSPTRVWVIWVLRPCRYLSTVTRNSNQGSVDSFRWERLQRLATFDSLSVQKRLEAMSRMKNKTIVCYLGGIWKRLEPLEQN